MEKANTTTGAATTKLDNTPKSKMTTYGKVIQKADTKMVVNDLLVQEDDYTELYWSDKNSTSLVLAPPYNPRSLLSLVTRNNILAQAVAAMESNIDGTGWTFEPIEAGEKDVTEKEALNDFFNEPFPDTSFTSIRRQTRHDLESTGNGYIEVIRTLDKEVALIRYLEAVPMRLCRLDDPITVAKVVTRKGKPATVNVTVRERRYVQKIGTKLIYFKEYGSKRQLDRTNGRWVAEGVTLAANMQASEVLHFTCESDASTPYGIPRWVNQLPSVVGSRKAEEFNLDFFDSGGVPPAVVFVQGGQIGHDVKTQLDGFFSNTGKTKHRVAVVEVQSTGGDLTSSGSVQVKTERFGDTRSNDAMFQNYDKNCEDHVRTAFRLPPLFLGRAADYNFATAQTAYMVTEAQVFQPERTEFDERLNITIIKDMGVKKWKFVSKPLTMKNMDLQLIAIDKVKQYVDPEELVETVNSIAGLNLKFSKAAADALLITNLATAPVVSPAPTARPVGTEAAPKADLAPIEVVKLVKDWAMSVGMAEGSMAEEQKKVVSESIAMLSDASLELFNEILSTSLLDKLVKKSESDVQLCGCPS